MTKVKLTAVQIEYLYYIFSAYTYPNIEITDPLYQLFSIDICKELTRIKNLKTNTKILKLNRLETVMFNHIISLYYLGIEHDKKLVWEQLFLIKMHQTTKNSN